MPEHPKFEVGDTVCTTRQIYFADAYDPDTGEYFEVRLPKREHLTVHHINDDYVECKSSLGIIIFLDEEDIK